MSRNDAILYSGASATKVKEAQTARSNEKLEQYAKLLPAAEVVKKSIDQQKALLGEILLDIVNPDSTDDQVQVKLEAVRLHRTWLLSYETEINSILRRASLARKVAKDE